MKAILKAGKSPNHVVEIEIGGSKSESNRLLILQALFPNISIKNISNSDDTVVLKNALKITKGTVDVHHAGTAMRFLTAYFAARSGAEVILTGSQRMQERPISILVDALRSLGADIQYLHNPGFPPLKIKGKNLTNHSVAISANVSSQFISALMLVAPSLPKGLSIKLKGELTSVPYIDMTLSLLKNLGIKAKFNGTVIEVAATPGIQDQVVTVASDWSSASYFYSLVALSEKRQLKLAHFSKESLQGDSAVAKIYSSLGVQTKFETSGTANTISLSKTQAPLPNLLLLDLSDTPDLAQTIAVSCFGLGVACRLTGLHTLKIKETDRLVALKAELEKWGAVVAIDDSSFQMEISSENNSGGEIDTYQDHRMAMAFAPLATKANLVINNAEVVSKSYPGFWEDLEKTGIECVLTPWFLM